jgi:hypothetical protein
MMNLTRIALANLATSTLSTGNLQKILPVSPALPIVTSDCRSMIKPSRPSRRVRATEKFCPLWRQNCCKLTFPWYSELGMAANVSRPWCAFLPVFEALREPTITTTRSQGRRLLEARRPRTQGALVLTLVPAIVEQVIETVFSGRKNAQRHTSTTTTRTTFAKTRDALEDCPPTKRSF